MSQIELVKKFRQDYLIHIFFIAAVILLIGLLLPGVHALELKATQVATYSFDAPDGNVIYQILVDQLPMGVNQTHTFKCGAATYYLTIESSNPYSIYYDFDIGFTFPNGTTQNLHKSVTRLPGAGYKTNIQPVYAQAESASFVVWTVDLEIGTSNQSVTAAINTGPAGWTPSDSIPFTSAQGTFGNTLTNVYLYTMTNADFQNHVVTYDPVYGLGNLGSTVFQWAWETILGFINQIPGIGPQFVSIIDILVKVIEELIFWIVWILTNLSWIIAALEVTIVMAAVIFAEKKPKAETIVKNMVQYNIAVFKGFIWAVDLVYTWLREFIVMVATAVGGIKPL